MFKKTFKKVLCGVLAVTASAASVVSFSACETDNPKVEMTIEFNGETYELEYKLYRKVAPATTNHFLKLVENGFYDGVCIHDYDMEANLMYTGGYTYSADVDNGGLSEKTVDGKTYFDLAASFGIPQTVWQDQAKTQPTYTLIGEFVGNGFSWKNGEALKRSFGSLSMYYSEKDADQGIWVKRADESKETPRKASKYECNSATSMFYISLATATTKNDNYCTFATLEDKSVATLEDLQAAITEYVEEMGEDAEFVEEYTYVIDSQDPIVGSKDEDTRETEYDVPVEPIVIKKVTVKKY